MAVRDARTLEQLRHEVSLMGPQGRADGWIPFTDIYETGWEDFGFSWCPLGYRRVGDEVKIELFCKRTSGTSLDIATLPEGFRPPFNISRGGIQKPDSFIRFRIYKTGVINMLDNTGDFGYVDISCSFYSPITRR